MNCGKAGNKLNSSYIEFKDVDFSYGAINVLEVFNMKIKKGEHIALVGESGCGKSSIAKLLLGFYTVQKGSIFIEGECISDMELSKLRKKFAYVPQEISLFNDTVYENIRYGRYEADKEEIIHAAKMSYSYDFIMRLENGFDTIVEEKGNNLSGGQCQRIALARALLKNAEILILDEATAALDNESEQFILDSIKKLGKDKTIITIAHRDKTIEGADRIINMGLIKKNNKNAPSRNRTCN